MSISAMISRLENIADAVPYANSIAELRSLGSQAMGTAVAIKEEFARNGINTESQAMLKSLEIYDRGNDLPTLRDNIHIILQQVAGYYRSKLTYL
ncbi:hypothetical protein ACFLXA_01215 [Chloroflexota bacterium]